jgi:hypothetical protein
LADFVHLQIGQTLAAYPKSGIFRVPAYFHRRRQAPAADGQHDRIEIKSGTKDFINHDGISLPKKWIVKRVKKGVRRTDQLLL